MRTSEPHFAALYAMDRVPAVFRWMARDAVSLQDYWGAVREVELDGLEVDRRRRADLGSPGR